MSRGRLKLEIVANEKREFENPLEILRREFCAGYTLWRRTAETFGVRFDEVELSWLQYCKARDLFMKHRDKNLYF